MIYEWLGIMIYCDYCEGPILDSACQKTNQALKSKELYIELIDRIGTISEALHQRGLYHREVRWDPLLSKRHMIACLQFDKRQLKDLWTIRNNIHWFDEKKTELFGC